MTSSPPEPERAGGPTPSSADLPYGPLPARSDQASGGQPPLSRPEPPGSQTQPARPPDPSAGEADIGEGLAQPSADLEISASRSDSDDDVHFGVAAKALGVSRKTVERMVKRGQLERGPSGTQATVSKRALVAVLEQRRRDVTQLTRINELEPGQSVNERWGAPWPPDATAELQDLLRPVLEPLIDEFVGAQSRAAVLEAQIDGIKAHAAQERTRDELLLALAIGGWRQRRKARRAALRHYVLRDDFPEPGS